MPILLYCLSSAEEPVNAPQAGVGGLPVSRVEHCGLAIFVTRDYSVEALTEPRVRESALQFHHVLRQAFECAAILPFRFPTVLADDAELKSHLENSSGRYLDLLRQYRTSVQMEILLSAGGKPDASSAASGTEYLRARKDRMDGLNRALTCLQSAVASMGIEWRLRPIPEGLRCFARVERDSVMRFNESLRVVALPSGYVARISGPWPATEFFDFPF